VRKVDLHPVSDVANHIPCVALLEDSELESDTESEGLESWEDIHPGDEGYPATPDHQEV
jgi:hypothetical protein